MTKREMQLYVNWLAIHFPEQYSFVEVDGE